MLNLKQSEDDLSVPLFTTLGAKYKRVGVHGDIAEKYDTKVNGVRIWLTDVFEAISEIEEDDVLLVHCAFGRDRTGIVISILLLMLDVPYDIVIEEYMLSDKAKLQKIETALEPFRDGDFAKYFRKGWKRINLDRIREIFMD